MSKCKSSFEHEDKAEAKSQLNSLVIFLLEFLNAICSFSLKERAIIKSLISLIILLLFC